VLIKSVLRVVEYHSVLIKSILFYLGVLFCVGGRGASGTPFKTIECYDPRKNQWFQVHEMSTRRRHVGVVAVGGCCYSFAL